MTDLDLLHYFALFRTQIVKLHAELHQAIGADELLQAKVELKLTPAPLAAPPVEGRTAFQLGARLQCEGYRAPDPAAESEPGVHVFSIECVLNAGYQQFQGEPVSFEVFSQHHASLTRQLYPLINHQLQPLLSQLGIPGVRLPQEIIQATGGDRPRQIH